MWPSLSAASLRPRTEHTRVDGFCGPFEDLWRLIEGLRPRPARLHPPLSQACAHGGQVLLNTRQRWQNYSVLRERSESFVPREGWGVLFSIQVLSVPLGAPILLLELV